MDRASLAIGINCEWAICYARPNCLLRVIFDRPSRS